MENGWHIIISANLSTDGQRQVDVYALLLRTNGHRQTLSPDQVQRKALIMTLQALVAPDL